MTIRKSTKASELLKKIERFEDKFGGREEMLKSPAREKISQYICEIARLKSDLNKNKEILSRMEEDNSRKVKILEEERDRLKAENEKLRGEIETLKTNLGKLSSQAEEFANWRKNFSVELLKKEDIIDAQTSTINSYKNKLKQYEDEIRTLNLKLASIKIARNAKKSIFARIVNWLNHTLYERR